MDRLCADCEAEMDHCHGTLIVHQEGVHECTEQGCFVLDTTRHDMVVDCAGIAVDCDCASALPVRFLKTA